jgi:hypothetical protein
VTFTIQRVSRKTSDPSRPWKTVSKHSNFSDAERAIEPLRSKDPKSDYRIVPDTKPQRRR